MSERDFNRKVGQMQNILIPAAEKAAGHALLATDRLRITKLIREGLADPDPRKLEELGRLVTPKAPTARPGFTETVKPKTTPVAEQAPAATQPAPKNPLVEERVRAELLARCQAARPILGRGLTAEEQADLEATIRERFGAAFAQGADASGSRAFGEAAMAGKLGPAKSPGFASPVLRSAADVAESVGGLVFTDVGDIGQLPLVDGDAAFHAAMTQFARSVSFGAQRLEAAEA